jgi:anti-sigma factor (TIGR02949 family)
MTEGRELDCEEVRELLSPYQDRELTPDEMTAIAEHLERCPDCMHKSTIFGQLSKIIKHWEGIKASEDAKAHLLDRVRRLSTRTQTKKTLPLLLLLILAGALVLGGAAALIPWFLSEGEGDGPERTAVASCVHKDGRVEVVTDGAPVRVEGRRTLHAGQELRCNLGAAAQLTWPAGGKTRATFVLRGPAKLVLANESTLRLRHRGTLVFHLPAGGVLAELPVVLADRWKIVLPPGNAVGLVELTGEGGIRVAMLEGSVRLGEGGPRVTAGTVITMDKGGALGTPKEITDRAAFELLVGKPGGGK